MAIQKPLTCNGCRLYDSDKFTRGGGAYPATVLFLGGSPPPWGGGLFQDKTGRALKSIIADLAKEERYGPYRGAGPAAAMNRGKHFLYCVQCPGGKLEKSLVTQCAGSVAHSHILACKPKVIVPLGAAPLASLGVVGGVRDLRGTVVRANICGSVFKVVPTLSPASLLKQPGVYDLIKGDIAVAARLAFEGEAPKVSLEELRQRYDFPQTLEEVRQVCTEYREYDSGRGIAQTMMSLDTETTSLHPWRSDARVIMVSAAVAPQKAFSIFLDHRDSPYDWREALPHVLSVTMSKHPKAWWNYKYDFSMFKFRLMPRLVSLCAGSASYAKTVEDTVGCSLAEILTHSGIRNTRWDGLMGEHILNEDKKGFYSLKSVIKEYAPEYGGYEEDLKASFADAAERKASRQSRAVFNVDVTKGIPGVEPDEFPFEVPSGTLLKDLQGVANSALRKRRSGAKKLLKAGDSAGAAALTRDIQGLEDWRECHKKTISGLERGAAAHKRELVQALSDNSAFTYEDIDAATLSLYAAIDADATLLISTQQRRAAHREDPPGKTPARRMIQLMDRHYLPLTETLADMQCLGVPADQEYLTDLGVLLKAEASALETKLTARIVQDLGYAPEKIVLNNPKFVGDVFLAGYGLPRISETDKGQASMNEAAIKAYAEMGNPIAADLLSWRKLCKAQSTYVDRLKTLSIYDHRIHGSIHLNGAATGRSSSSSPNLQNTPHFLGKVNIKKIFVTSQVHSPSWWERDGNKSLAAQFGWTREDRLCWVDMDFSGAEVRVLTRYAPDENLIKALKEGLDIHSWMTAEIHGMDYDTINKGRKTDESLEELRRKTKQVVFGTIYGITSHGLQQRMGFTEEEAEETIAKLLNRFPAIQRYIRETHETVSKDGAVRTPYGRARRFPMVNAGRWMAGRNKRQAVNFLIQSYCSDIVMSCLSSMGRHIHEVRGRMLLTVHDSVCFEMPISEYPKLAGFLRKSLRDHIESTFPDMPVAMPYDVKVGWNYGETEDQEVWESKNPTFVA
jgi:DNA polymerase I-like protein with 3'-5' exonuclease and polymerase domains/uracil-DNA glycosylase